MGIKLFGSSAGSTCSYGPVPAGNPNPCNYSVITSVQIGRYLIAFLKYPDCTNFEGRKILVFKDVNERIFTDSIDPHFFDDDKSPIARFVPTKEGFMMACSFAEMLDG